MSTVTRFVQDRWIDVTSRRRVIPDEFASWVSRRLPRRVVMHAVVRVWAHGTVGRYGATNPHELTVPEALHRWEEA